MKKTTKQERNERVNRKFELGMTQAQIAKEMGLSRQRVHAILKDYFSYKPKNKPVDNFGVDTTSDGVKI